MNSTAEDLSLFKVTPSYYRSLPTELCDKLVANDHTLTPDDACNRNGQLMGGTSGMRIGMLESDLVNGYVSVGTGISVIHSIQTVKEVIEEMMSGYKKGVITIN